ncbi:MAG: D-TA family PLP-dependent enzyme [Chloroflexota bacterium]|nr:D-TA family PLP-dependent enzyme [Chloroflexota bacterium]
MHIEQLETPVAFVDLDRLAANIDRFQAYLDGHGIANRPHIKTHKIPAIAHMQLKAGAVGVTCQKLGEAEIMADAAIDDLFLPYNILGAAKLERLMHLARRTRISVTADNHVVVDGLSTAARAEGTTLPVLVECDTGAGRCGVQTPEAAADLARRIARSPGLRFGGLMTYPNSVQMDRFVQATKALVERDGLAVERVSGGGTACMWQVHEHPSVTEHRAGMYIYGDRGMVQAGAMTLADCAFGVITTVVSRPTSDRGVLDAGSKALSSDLLGLDGYGLILEYPQARIEKLSEEHGHVDFSACDRRPEIGERVTVLPNHCCVVSNLFNQIVGVRQQEVEVVWPVAARGMLQ